ncbi:glycosyltransferase family 2 protein [Stappia indica]|uniref:glycosyltransferase family 2 protein n=1 Tax=Stappia indica TaxID=538381 RepID=UPI00082C4A4F|nr:glycosyltransferase family 2 protein [Stappia indica]
MPGDGIQHAGEADATAPLAAARLSVVLPTYNERDNLPVLIDRLDAALAGIAWEAIVVDDNSPDGTADVARAIAARDPRVRVIRRVGRRGLSGACVEGMLASSADYVAVMDADLQHDETLLPKMLAALSNGAADLAVASRHVEGGDVGTGLSGVRASGSGLANRLARVLLKVTLSDPMSGFFMIRRSEVERLAPGLSSQGFKILLDIVATARGSLRIVELPFVFRERLHGESKLDTLVALDFLGLILSKLVGDLVSIRFLMFMLVGASGVLVHMAALFAMMELGGLSFPVAQTAATFVAMTTNFWLNNRLTYRDRRLRGFAALRGLVTFYVVCSVGVVANVGVASLVYQEDAGRILIGLAGLAGAVMGAVWNYAASSVLTWRKA